MERLTPNNLKRVCYDTWELCGLDDVCKRDCHKPVTCKIPNIIYRLAKYEDTGLTPEEITKIFDDYRDTNLSQAQELYDLEQERDTLKNALELACDAFDYTPSGHTLMDLYIQQAREGNHE